ncbi:MAG TPA: Ig-like domain-containing protein, partial [Blastocatellia bacterium]|nr:Ig-like domain-containing protein [Blastocatellia bacterium]
MPVVQNGPPNYNIVIRDDSSGDMIRLDSNTGQYEFNRCSDGFVLTGWGPITSEGCEISLWHTFNGGTIQAQTNTCLKTGTGRVFLSAPGVIYNLSDSNTANNPGSIDKQAPMVIVTAPNGGEIVDTGSTFTISWQASDNVGVASQEIRLSTNAGATFSTIAANLAGNLRQYNWTAPASVNNRNVRVRVIARDAACNARFDESDANFRLWNPPAAFTHIAEAPFYVASGGFDAYVHLSNASASTLIVELGWRKITGNATPSDPTHFALAPGEARKLRVADYFTPGTPADTLVGGIRLRHNGANAQDVQAMLTINQFGEEQAFSTPFVYAAAQSAAGTMQCAPLFYVDDHTSAMLALQNFKNYPVEVGVKLVYGTGMPGTPNGEYYLPRMTLAGQQRVVTDLRAFKDQLNGAKWGSIVVSAPAQSVAAHTVMKSAQHGLAFSSEFVDPSLSTTTTKVANLLKLDYDTGLTACIMVCNTSSTGARTVTATFQTDNGVVIPSRQMTLGPGQQQLIELDPRQLLSPGQSAMADARLTYVGSGADIMAGAVSMSAQDGCAITARFVEPKAADGRELIGPYFRIDARTKGMAQISNLGASQVRAGLSLRLANANQPPITTDLVTVPAGKTVTVDLQQYIEQAPDGLTAEGRISLLHNGPPGTVTCAVINLTPDPLATPLAGGPPTPEPGRAVYVGPPSLQAGEATPVYGIAVGGGPVTWSASAGTITSAPSSDPDVHAATYTPPDDGSEPEEVTITMSTAGGMATATVTIQKVKLKSIATRTAQGVNTNGRLNPDGGTVFELTGKKPFPDVPLQVRFQQKIGQTTEFVSVDTLSRPAPDKLVGTAPMNTKFVGDVQVLVFAGTTQISKKTLCEPCASDTPDCGVDGQICSAYYAY